MQTQNAAAVKKYISVDNARDGAAFEERWIESVIMILKRIKDNEFDMPTSHRKLLEVCEGLQWVQENLNEALNSQHRTLLKSIYSTNIQILNGAMQTKNLDLLPIVVSTLETIGQPYKRA